MCALFTFLSLSLGLFSSLSPFAVSSSPTLPIRQVFTAAGAKTTEPLIVSCGSGMTAAALALALETLQSQHVRLYDGSWSEYGIADAKRPVATN